MILTRGLRVWVCLSIALTLAACSLGPGEEITSTKPYADLVGERYSVVTDNLYAYGVYESIDKKIGHVTLVPRPGLSGPEFAFRRNVPKGQVLTILGAWRQFKPFDSGVDLIRFGGHLPKGGYDVPTDGRHSEAPAAPAV